MNFDSRTLAKLDSEYDGYLEGPVVDEFLRDFGIKFAAGHWCAGEFFDRFCPVGYNSDNPDFDNSVVAQIERVAKAGIAGIEFHEAVFLNPDGSVNHTELQAVKDALKTFDVVPTNMNFNTWTNPQYKFGGITHPDAGVRKACLSQIHKGVDLAKELGCVSCNLWPGSDGWDYHFEVDYGQRLRWYIEGNTEIAEHCDRNGLKFGNESKQKEPREGNMIINTVAKAALVALEVNKNLGKTVMGVVIDYGHEQMVGNTPADSLYLLKTMGVPIANFHINGAKFNSNDEDRIAGTDDIWRLVEFCYAAVDTEYDGWFGEDQFTYRTEQVESMALSREFFANCMKKALKIYAQREALRTAQDTGDAGRVIQLVKRVIYNG
ncbi:MAG: sugar phosphate isomerase/epimerase [Fimbriimonadaceae bacterium]|nr:sugar phosphate isomerase/epimerase [Fimbriimonadaceae bacterium]